jgi:steroid 5-alpha reductase family enzyme
MAEIQRLGLALVAASLIMSMAWVAQRRARNIGWVDVYWTLATAGLGLALDFAWPETDFSPARRMAIGLVVAAWGLRLAGSVAMRVASSDEDGRYKEIREDWGAALQLRLFGFLQLQALVAVVLAAGVGAAANRPGPWPEAQDLIGLFVAAIAVSGEALADSQLRAFARDPDNHGGICERGLWAWSRHPNYFFEWLGWCAYPIIAFDAARPPGPWLWSLAGPILMYAVLRHGTGVPPLERHMLRTRGEAFRRHQTRVSVFFPRPPRTEEPLHA